ncbi:MAG TPA: anthranilate synthase component I family protein, partial [Chloroflexota bacterium]|nr:anthranilate synthase component I family protein [Chloroflexota bacterium]
RMRILSHADVEACEGDVERAYGEAEARIEALAERIQAPLSATSRESDRRNGAAPQSTFTRDEYGAAVERAVEYIRAGDIIQVVPSQRLSRPLTAHPFNVYRALRAINPSPYMYLLHLDDTYVVGASPEMLVQVEDGTVRTRPIAGTRPRGENDAEDAALAADLLGDEKERAEHIMLVDLGRNDLGRVCQAGTVTVSTLMDVEKYSHVMHIVSQVEGRLRADCDAYDALRSCFPAGTVSGAPKIRAMEIIAELEPCRRGTYAGAVGYFSFDGNLDTAITIRTMVIKDGVAHVQAGGGVVADSQPEYEYQESLNKAAALLRSLDVAGEVEEAEEGRR